jgi:integrase
VAAGALTSLDSLRAATRLGIVLDEVELEGSETPSTVAAIRLLILTGCRLGEIQTMKWSYVQGGLLNLPDSKTGAKKVYLAPVALNVLRGIERVPENDYVITGKSRANISLLIPMKPPRHSDLMAPGIPT